MADIGSNILHFKQSLTPNVRLVAVSKTRSVADIMTAYDTGQRCFGENRVQELLSKKDLLPSDIEWHLIGHLQSNKVKFIVPFISLIQSVDSFKLLTSVNNEASGINRVVDCLLQIHIAKEETKFGFSISEIEKMIESPDFRNLNSVRICGLMGMATFTPDQTQVRNEFKFLADHFNYLKGRYFATDDSFREISMGMSGDYEIAVAEGSTMVRIGSLLFGERKKI